MKKTIKLIIIFILLFLWAIFFVHIYNIHKAVKDENILLKEMVIESLKKGGTNEYTGNTD